MATKKTTKPKAKKPVKKASAKKQAVVTASDAQIPEQPTIPIVQTDTPEAEAQVDATRQTEPAEATSQPTPPDVVQVTPQIDASTSVPSEAPVQPAPEDVVAPEAPVQPVPKASPETVPTDQEATQPEQPEITPPEKQLEETTPPPFSENEAIFAEDDESGPSIKKLLFIFLSALIIGALIVGAYFYWQSTQVQSPTPEGETTQDPTNTPEEPEEDTEEATDSADIEDEDEEESTGNFSGVSVQILNGSGTAGEAGAVQDLLEPAGFDTFETGNADNFEYTDTEVQAKESVDEKALTAITEALEDTYTVVEGDSLDDDSSYDVVVIVGQQK